MNLLKITKLFFAISLSFLLIPYLSPNDFTSYALTGVGTSCTASGHSGTCRDRNSTSCSGYYDSGKHCPGPAQVQCCVATQIACRSGTGICHNSSGANKNSCSGGKYYSGYCPGPSDVQCCVAPKSSTGGTTTTGKTQVSLDLLMHGIGKAGDSQNPGAAGGGNTSPVDTDRDVVVNIYATNNTPKASPKGTVTYDSTSGSFKGKVDLGSLPAGQYVIKVKLPQSLETQIGNIWTVTAGATLPLPQTELVTGDINGDGAISLNVYDYNTLLSCIQGDSSCSDDKMKQADITDDGKVDLFDFNLFIREIANLSGQE